MSKLERIQQELKAINQASIQKLGDAYLYKLGYENIHSIGSVVGKQKTKIGTPDTLITLPNGNYIFVEYTTQERGTFKKLAKDIDKCFDESKTGIPIKNIEKVIVFHNLQSEPDKAFNLEQKCKERNVDFENIDIDILSFALCYKYPQLANEFLGIEIDTRQILNYHDFVKEHDKNRFVTPLGNIKFYFREEELTLSQDALTTNDVLLIVGKSGTGKTKLALEYGEKFIDENGDFQFYCISNKGLDLYSDLMAYFTVDKKYLILVDDANRVAQLEHIFGLLNKGNNKSWIKIIVTVRDYAVEQVQKRIRKYADYSKILLSPFEDKHIQTLLSDEFGIKNQDYLDRICRIAKGNPRLSIMAAQIALKINRLDSLNDVSQLYDEYYSSLNKDIDGLSNQRLLQVASIISFFRVIDRSVKKYYEEIISTFNFSDIEFWEKVRELHEMEVVDLYENEVVKVSDQILSTYLFYKVFIKDQLLDFTILLDRFFFRYQHRFRDAVYPIFEVFDGQFIAKKLQKHIDYKWEQLKKDEEAFLQFIEFFWFLKNTETLLFLQESITQIAHKDFDNSTLTFEPNNGGVQDKYLQMLSRFRYTNDENFHIAVTLIFDYLERDFEILPQILSLLSSEFSFEPADRQRGYIVQTIVFNSLIERAKAKPYRKLFENIFLHISCHYLKTHFSSSWTEGNVLHNVHFELVNNPELLNLRRDIFTYLIYLYENSENVNSVIQVLNQYTQRHIHITEDIAQEDAKYLLPFLISEFNPNSYIDCTIVQQYLSFLERHHIEYDGNIQNEFSNPTYVISKLLLDQDEMRLKLGWQEYQKYKSNLMISYFANYSLNNYIDLITSIKEISESFLTVRNKKHSFKQSVTSIFLNLASTNSTIFRQFVEYLIMHGNPIRETFEESQVIHAFATNYNDKKALYDFLQNHNYPFKSYWLLSFLQFLNKEQTNSFYLEELYQLYRQTDVAQIPNWFDYLENYIHLDESVYINVLAILFNRVQQGENFNFFFLFTSQSFQSKLDQIFNQDIDLLKSIYLYQQGYQNFDPDYQGAIFEQLLVNDQGFIIEYLQWICAYHKDYSKQKIDKDYDFIWRMAEHKIIVSKVIDFIWSHRNRFYLADFYLEDFFENPHKDAFIEQRILAFFSDFITTYYSNLEFVRFIFTLITKTRPQNRKEFLEVFLKYNKDFDAFKTLPIEPLSWSRGDYEERISFLESLLSLFKPIIYLKHKHHVQELIHVWQYRIEEETKRAFIGDF